MQRLSVRWGGRRAATRLVSLGVFLAVQQLLWPAPLGVVLHGAVIGGLTALVAVGIALVYRANHIVNFAQGDLGAVPASLAVLLIAGTGLPFLVALLAGLAAAVVLGAVVELLVIRRFFHAPRLVLTVATIGLAQVLAGAGVVLPRLFHLTRPAQSFPSPLHLSFTVRPITFSGNDVLAMGAIPVALASVAFVLRRTDVGIAVRASAESADRAALLGIPVRRLETGVWALATVLAFGAVFLRAGVIGLPIGTVLGPGLLLPALAAAVIGNMQDLPVVAAAAVCLGILEQAVVWHTGTAAYVDPILFVVVLGALLVTRPRAAARGSEQASTWQAAREPHPLPRAMAGLPEIRWGRRLLVVTTVGVLVGLPLVLSDAAVDLASAVLIFAMIGLSLVVLTGWAGHVSLGQMAIVGIGGAVGGALSSRAGWDLALVVPAAGVAGSAAAMLIGLPALRVRGLRLAVTTLALALAASSWALNPRFVPWLPVGRLARRPLLGVVGLGTETRFYEVSLAALALALLAVRGLRRSRTGRVLIATRENPRAAAAFGVDTAGPR